MVPVSQKDRKEKEKEKEEEEEEEEEGGQHCKLDQTTPQQEMTYLEPRTESVDRVLS